MLCAMKDRQGPGIQTYYGLPRFLREWFRATKVPSIILFAGFLGEPILLTLITLCGIIAFHSAGPTTLFILGILQYRLDGNQELIETLSPQLRQLLQTASPLQKQMGRHFFDGHVILCVILTVTLAWWIVDTVKFLSERATHKRP